MNKYEKPEVRELGDLVAMTQATFNKIGSTPDVFTVTTQGAVVGSLVMAP